MVWVRLGRSAPAIALLSIVLLAVAALASTDRLPSALEASPPLAVDIRTANLSLELRPNYHTINVYLSFDDDEDGDNVASMEYRKAGDVTWKPGMAMTVDRRQIIWNKDCFPNGPSPQRPEGCPGRSGEETRPNTGCGPHGCMNQWRAAVLGLDPGTQYEVRITLSDPDGLVGATSPIGDVARTRIETDQIPSNGRDLHVSTTGSDANGDGFSSNPWRTIQKAADRVRAGDTVHVMAGVYRENVLVLKDGAPDNYITFRNYRSDLVEIQPRGPLNYADDNPGLRPPLDRCAGETSGFATDADHIRIKGFRVVGGNQGIRLAGSSKNVIVEDNYITDFAETGAGIRIGGQRDCPGWEDKENSVQFVTVQNNTIIPKFPQTRDWSAIASHAFNRGGHVIRWNYIEFKYVGDGTHGEDCFVSGPNSEYHDVFKDTDIYENVCVGATDDAVELDGNNVLTKFWGNTIVSSNVAVSIGASGVGPTYVFRNLFYAPTPDWTRCLGVKQGRGGTGHVFFYHNVFHLENEPCTDGSWIITSSAGSPGPSSNIYMINNIQVFEGRHVSIAGSRETPSGPNELISDYNLNFDADGGLYSKWYGTEIRGMAALPSVTGLPLDAHSIFGRATFVDEANGDFRLAEGSLGIDAGLEIVGFNDPQSPWPYSGSAPDVGAFEFDLGDPPVRFGGGPTGELPSTTQAMMSLATSQTANCRYSTAPGTPCASMTGLFTSTDDTSHSTAVPGLTHSASYIFYVRCINTNEVANDDDFTVSFLIGAPTFTTTPAPRRSIFSPTQDATVKEQAPATPFGLEATLEVDADNPSGSGLQKWFYLTFVLSDVMGKVTSATINIHNSDKSVEGGAVYVVADAGWDESTITWHTRPAIGEEPIVRLGSVDPGNWYSLDVTPVVTRAGVYSFAVVPTHNNGASYESLQGSNAPYLEVLTVAGGTSPPKPDPATTVGQWGPVATAAVMALIRFWRSLGGG